MAFAIVGFLFVVNWAVTPNQKWPWSTNTASKVAANTNDGTICTADAKLCPDGSYVGRSEPNCEFAACPDANANSTTSATPAPGYANVNEMIVENTNAQEPSSTAADPTAE